jgi:hypothetical protein
LFFEELRGRKKKFVSEKDASSESGNEFSEESYVVVVVVVLHLLRLVMIVH